MNTIELTNELSQNFIDFSHEANCQRAFADARDGLKPGQRACLWEMFIKGYHNNKPHVKSAKISGGVIATWWPHGDTAIYDTFARMSQSWINNIPEVDWHGANGSVQISNEPAASRYTEARLSKAAEIGLLYNIKKNNVPMKLNFSEDEKWPEVFPAILPRLMINGCQGIGSTIANVWLPHNLSELYQIIKKYIDTGEIDYNNIFPSFPSGGIIINKDELSDIYKTGKGKVILRAKTEIKDNIINITEIPYQVYVEPLIDQIKELIKKDEITGIANILNKSDKKKLLIEIECETNPHQILNVLFNKTDLQKNYNANQYALVGKTPKLLNLKEYLDVYLNHNYLCIKKENEFDLNKAQTRLEIVEGLLKALEDIDNIIKLIKSSESAIKAKENLISKYNFTENQAKAIIDMKLGKLAHLEKIELNKEQEELISTINICNSIIQNKNKQKEIFLSRLSNLVENFKSIRKTELTQIKNIKEEKILANVMPEDVVVVVSYGGDIKRIPKKNFKIQHKKGIGTKTLNDTVLKAIATNTVDNLMLFTSTGKMYKLGVSKIPEGTNASKGTNIKNILPFENNEKIQAVTSFSEEKITNVIFFTKKGLIKKTLFSEYSSMKKTTGIQAIKLKDNDELLSVSFMNEEDILIVSKKGMITKIPTNDIKAIGRLTSGVKGINLKEDDEVVAAFPVNNQIGIITNKGKGKRINTNQFIIQARAGRGVTGIKLDPEDYVVSAVSIEEKDTHSLLVVGRPHSICIPINELPEQNRLGAGSKIIENSMIQTIAKI